jgi:hypothetical protein
MTKVLTLRVHPEVTRGAHITELLQYLHSEIQGFVDAGLSNADISQKLEPVGLYSVCLVDDEGLDVDLLDQPQACHVCVLPFQGMVH